MVLLYLCKTGLVTLDSIGLTSVTLALVWNQQTASCSLPIVILEGNGPTLFVQNWLSYIGLNWSDICHIGFGVEGHS